MRTHSNCRGAFGWTALAGVIVFGLMCVPFFLGRVYTADDLGEFHLPIRDFYSRQLAAGESWDWMPSLFCGFYLTGEGQLGGYHPLHLLLYRMLPLGAAFNVELLLNYPFLAVGTYLFLRRIVVRRDAAAFGSLIFTFSSFNLLHFVHPNAVAVVAHIPWLLWAIDLACQSHDRRTVYLAQCGIALLTGSQLLLGYPQYVWFSLLCEFSYAAVRLYRNERWVRRAAGLLAATLVGGLIGAVQVLPTADALANSTRIATDHNFFTNGSLHPLNLVQPFAPYLFTTRVVGQNTHELGMYFGCVPLVLCFWLWLNRAHWGRSARVIWPTIIFGSIALLYALGEYASIDRLQAAIPFVRNFRFPCRAIVLVELAVAVLSAIALVQLVRNRGTPTHHIWIPALLSVFIAIFAAVMFKPYVSSWMAVAIGPVLIILATWIVSCALRSSRGALNALLILGVGDLGAYGLSYGALRNTHDLNTFAAAADMPPHPTTGRIATDVGSPFEFGNRLTLSGFSLVDGYAGLKPARSLDYSELANLGLARAEWQHCADKTLFDWQFVPSSASQAEFLSGKGSTQLTRTSASTIDVVTSSDQDETLFISEGYHAGWTAQIDGRIVPVVRMKGDFLGCHVPRGRHRVEFRFEPSSLRYGFLLTMCGLGLTGAMFAVGMSRSNGRDS